MKRRRIVIIGASMAGLAAAAAAARHFDEVVIVERDALSPVGPRKGVPQGVHTHLLLDRGRAALERLLPGLSEELVRAGARVIDPGREMRWFHASGWKVEADLGYQLYSQRRSLLEATVRQRVLGLPGVGLCEQTRVNGLVVEDGAVVGARLEGPAGTSALDADVVIDASGRGSRAAEWLEGLGYGIVLERRVAIDLTYGTLELEPPPELVSRWGAIAVFGRRPDYSRHAVALAVEGGHWLVTVAAYGGDRPSRDVADFIAELDRLARPDIAAFAGRARPVGEVETYRYKEQHRRRFSALRLPEGFGVVGDAACSLDPVFGQGMAVAALTAEALDHHLAGGRFSSRRFARAVERISRVPWEVTSIEAFRYTSVAGPRPWGLRLSHRLLDRIYARSTIDPRIYRAFGEVMMLHRGPAHFLRPDLLWRLFRPVASSDPRRAQPGQAS